MGVCVVVVVDLAGCLQHLHLTTVNNDRRQQAAQRLEQKPTGQPAHTNNKTISHHQLRSICLTTLCTPYLTYHVIRPLLKSSCQCRHKFEQVHTPDVTK